MARSKSLLHIALIAAAASGLALAQPAPPQAPPSNGAWRRVSDPPPTAHRDPEPVDRTDAYGQPIQGGPQPQQPVPPPEQRPNDRPMDRPAYAPPSELTLKPGTYITIRSNQFLSTDHNQPGDTFSGTLV